MEVGVFSLTDIAVNITVADRVGDVIELGEHVDEVELDVFGVGEHHTRRFAVSSPAVVLAAVAARTSSIHVTTTVSVLSVLDPARPYQDFAQLDLVSRGRAEATVGRSAYAEPFGLFGVPMDEYEAVFDEKLELLLALRKELQRTTGRPEFRRGRREDRASARRPWDRPLPGPSRSRRAPRPASARLRQPLAHHVAPILRSDSRS